MIISAYELATLFFQREVHVVSGFHSRIELRVLEILLRGTQPITIVPARSLEKFRVPREWREGIDSGRIRLLSPFVGVQHRVTRELARERNRFVLQQTEHVLFIHASPGGETESLCREAIDLGKRVYTLKSPNNQNLVGIGARPVTIDELFSAESKNNSPS